MSRPREYPDQLIFQGVHQALSKTGYAKLTLERIATEIHISPAALSKRFGSKKSLLLAYSDAVIEQIKISFHQVQLQEKKPLKALAHIFLSSVKAVDSPQTLANITSLYVEGIADPDLLARSRTRLQLIDDQVRSLLNRAVEEGEIKPCDTAKVSRVLQAAVGGALMIWIKEPDRTLTAWTEDCMELIIGPLRLED